MQRRNVETFILHQSPAGNIAAVTVKVDKFACLSFSVNFIR